MPLNINYISDLLNYEKLHSGLYIVSTPIGNLSDITLRALKVLSSVDIILCEDTRISKRLTIKYGINTKLISFHKFNTRKIIPSIITKLSKGFSIALISDSGTPLISDPGSDLINECNNKNFKVTSIPGPSATTASIVLSSFYNSSFSFHGFFPRQKKEIKIVIQNLKKSLYPLIFFESPKRIIKTLKIIQNEITDCRVTFIRELTKKYEEIFNTTLTDLIAELEKREKIVGEISFIIEPLYEKINSDLNNQEIIELANKLLNQGENVSNISKELSQNFGISKREIYQILIKNMK